MISLWKKNWMIQSKSSDQFILVKTIKKLVKIYESWKTNKKNPKLKNDCIWREQNNKQVLRSFQYLSNVMTKWVFLEKQSKSKWTSNSFFKQENIL